MDYNESLSISQFVRKEKARIEAEEGRLKEERAHLDWLLKKAGQEEFKTVGPQSTFITDQKSDLLGMTVQESVEKILEEALPKSLMSKEILAELRDRGGKKREKMTLDNLHAHMSKLASNADSRVMRTEVGYYSVKQYT